MSFKKEAKEIVSILRKRWNYSRDLLSEKALAECDQLKKDLEGVFSAKKADAQAAEMVARAPARMERIFPGCLTPNPWVENIEVLFVAIVIALAIRTYIVQPFKIPTDSMKPTLWGIYTEPRQEPAPNMIVRFVDLALYGRIYHHLEAPEDGEVMGCQEKNFLGVPFLTYTEIQFNNRTLWVGTELSNLSKGAPKLYLNQKFKAGEAIANFSTEAGDHIFVNKMTYNFRRPKQGEPFVFSTHGIEGLQGRSGGISQYYIKRCVGVPGVTLKIDEPYLLSNGQVLHSLAFDRIYSKAGGYHGYVYAANANYLTGPQDEIQLPEDQYWAMGDNSANSLDSRYWKFVPRENLVGTATFVYWPLTKRWGWIH